jgi:hypothetical protein
MLKINANFAGTVTVVLAEHAAAVLAPVLAAARLAFLFEFARAVEDKDAFSAALRGVAPLPRKRQMLPPGQRPGSGDNR